MRIPISSGYTDTWYWDGDPRGNYSVKNGYIRIVGNYEDSNDIVFNKWLALWKLKIPPKWKTFLWKALSDILPTTKNLLIKRVDVEPTCAMCGIIHEDTMHALVLCDYANNIWSQSNLPIPDTNVFHELFSKILDFLDTDEIMYAAAILYHIWRARNNAVWDAYLPKPRGVLAAATAAMHAWRQIHHITESPATIAPTETLQAAATITPPGRPPGRCLVDAGYHRSANTASVGAVLLEAYGGFISAFASSLLDCFSPFMAEAFTCKEALSWLRDRGERSIELYTDCLTFQQYLSSTTNPDRTYIGYAIDSCKTLLASFDSCSVKFIPRSENYLTHTLATSAFSQTAAMYWDTTPPDSISAYFE
ncbi:PREDICTED: uncharacterized protein LOC109152102 [Ipomoea nil]|uniref:uncharacterized protein LOC109152102 n=1 Tax=Ipomoea nil TaxID=35883 RepID=UPI0009011ECD|nr:PREDICTED: uncharacterized protein LOC109152102 [Ipomoea nil]